MKKRINLNLVILLILSHTICHGQWQSLGSGITKSPRDIFSISAVNEDVIWAVTTNWTSGISYDYTRSVDGGKTWTAGFLSDTIGAYYPGSIFALDAQTAWMLMIKSPQQDRVKLFKTINGGSSWQEHTGEFNKAGSAFASIHFFNQDEGLCFGSPGTDIPSVDSLQIYRTSNGGENWNRIPSTSLPAPLAKEGVWIYGDNRYESKGDTLWFGTRAARVFRTIDRGLTWQAFPTGISGNSDYPGLASIAFQDSKNGIVTTYQPSKAAMTTDGGVTWTKITIPPSPGAADIEYIPGTTASYIINEGWLTGTNTSKFLITHDQGETWTTNSFTPAIPVLRFLSPTAGFAGGKIITPDNGGIYKWTGNLTSSSNKGNRPEFKIDIYPNPIKDKFMLRLNNNIAGQNKLLLKIYDVNGQNIKQVAIASDYTNVDINDLPVGIYLYKLSDNQNVLAKGKLVKL